MADSDQAAAAALRSFEESDILRTDRDGRPVSGTGLPGVRAFEGNPEFAGLFTFAKAWLAGDLEKASRLLPQGPNRRIPLPGYVFDHKHYWVDAQVQETVKLHGTVDSPRKLPFGEWFHFPGWERVALQRTGSSGFRPILLVHEGGAYAARCEDALRAAGLPFIACRGGEGLGSRLSGIAGDGGLPATCWHLSSLSREPAGAEAYADGLELMLQDIRILTAAYGEGGMELVFFSPASGGGPDAIPAPSFAYMEAACAVIPHEYKGVRARVLRIDPSCIDAISVRAAAESELLASGDRILALSHGSLWRRTYAKLAPPITDSGVSRLVERGVYLITGGTGGIGLTLAGYLARTCRARLLLLSRNGPDAAALEAVMVMRGVGAEVRTFIVDVADTDAVRAVVDEACALWGRIDGVIHAAGVGGGSLIAGTRRQEIDRVVRAKVAGTLALAAALREREPGFVLLCSSLTAALGGLGQAAYAAANAWLDAWAEAQGAIRPGVWTSVQWDGWASVGMAARLAAASAAPSDGNGRELVLLRSWTLSPETFWPWGEHLVNGVAMLPGTAYLELFVQALTTQWPVVLGEVTLMQPMIYDGGGARKVRVLRDGDELVLQSDDGARIVEHARARLDSGESLPAVESPDAARARCCESVDAARLHSQSSGAGSYIVEAGGRWRIDGEYWKGEDESVATFELPAQFAGDLVEHPLHPALMDVAISYYISFVEEGTQLLPWRYGKLFVHAPLTPRLSSCVRLRSRSGRTVVLDVDLFDESGRLLARIEGYTLVRPGAGGEAESTRRAASPAGNPFAMTPAEGVEVFLRALASPEPVLCISTVEWKFAENPVVAGPENGLVGRGKEGESTRKPRPEQETPFIAPRTKAEELMAEVWGEVLGYGGLGIDDDLFELGADSLSALQAMVRVEELTGSPFSMERFFSGPTIASLAGDIEVNGTDGERLVAVESIEQWEEGEL
jgi:acyl carrier protein